MNYYGTMYRCCTLALMLFIHTLLGATAYAESPRQAMQAYYLHSIPAEYDKLDKTIAAFSKSGADTIVVRPVLENGSIDKRALKNAVYLAHQSGLRIVTLLPSRRFAGAISDHPDWEDSSYDVKRGSIQRTGKLDLFNPAVMVYLTDLFRSIAEYSVDGIFLDEDFTYAETEGMSSGALALYNRKFGASLDPAALFAQRKSSEELGKVGEYSSDFWRFAEMKSDRLSLLLKNIIQSTKAVNQKIIFGISVPVEGMPQVKERLAWYSFDLKEFQKLAIDYYWVVLPHRDIRERQHLTYKKSMEIIARMAKSAVNQVKEPAQMIFAIQTAAPSGKTLPVSEIEDALEMVRHAGEPGIALMADADTVLPAGLTRKAFMK